MSLLCHLSQFSGHFKKDRIDRIGREGGRKERERKIDFALVKKRRGLSFRSIVF